ncbi:MAG: HK97 gp10 family phage protein [Campylobacterales bacterium]|nr:HK97 gp10 family phage protein [Campylobacterales bacterium]
MTLIEWIEKRLFMRDLAATVASEARREAPKDTGELRASIDVISITASEAIVGHKLNPNIVVNWGNAKTIYPLFVHEGTSAHVIEPKSKKALHWNGAPHPAKKVNHPGTKANPYFERALQSPKIEAVLSKYGDELTSELAIDLQKNFS